MTTMQDVAKLAGVSTATVSRALAAPDTVADETREKIHSAVNRLSYVPNSAARSLRTLRTRKILVMVPDISNPFFANIIRGIGEAAENAGYAVLLGNTRHEMALEEQYASMLQRKEADGLIFLGHRLPAAADELRRQRGKKAPIVNGCEYSPRLGVSSVHIDNVKAAYGAMDYLYSLGHRTIGIITGPLSSPLSRDRLQGVKSAAAKRGFGNDLIVSESDFSVAGGERNTRAFLARKKRPTAIFCFADEMAIGALEAIGDLELACPKDVSVVGFDDINIAHIVRPTLTTIRQPMEEIGRQAVRILLGILDGSIQKITLKTLGHKLILRDSSGPAPSATALRVSKKKSAGT